MSEFIGFTLVEDVTPQRKTQVWQVRSTRDDSLLGVIKWFGRWRQYALFPEPGTVWNPECLHAVNVQIRKLMGARKAKT